MSDTTENVETAEQPAENTETTEGVDTEKVEVETKQESEDILSPPSSARSSVPAESNKTKIEILLKSTGDAPIMKKSKWTIEPEKKIAWIIMFVRKYLKMDSSDSLFLYVNQAFAPSPDQTVKNLYDCFETDGKLVFYYCRTQAWG